MTGCASVKPPATPTPTVTLDDGTKARLDATCDGLRAALDALVDTAIEEGTDNVVLATEALTVKYDEACG